MNKSLGAGESKELVSMDFLVLKKRVFLVECIPSVHAKGNAFIFGCCYTMLDDPSHSLI